MKLIKSLLLAGALCAAASAWAQTDVTATYLANPSFETDAAACVSSAAVNNSADGLRGYKVAPSGWTMSSTTGTDLLITVDCFTDNNFGKTAIADGDYAFYQRVGWTSLSTSLSQTTETPVAKGDYELTFLVKAFCANNAASTISCTVRDAAGNALADNSFACKAGSAGIMASSQWEKKSLKFRLEDASKLTIAIAEDWVSGGSCVAIDDFKLIQLPDGSLDPGGPTIEGGTEDEVQSPVEGSLSGAFVPEAQMKADLLQMLADFTKYGKSIYTTASNNSKGEACGYFKGNSAGQNNEDGVRSNADLAMVFAFVWKYGDGKVTLPSGITRADIKNMAMRALTYGYSTHKANKTLKTTNNAYWGSTSKSDNQWESSLWAMSLAYAAHFLDSELTAAQKDAIYAMIKAECNYELERNVPVGYNGDTKAEENGWEADILACALGLYPDDALAPKWFDRLRAFAINSYSHYADAQNNTIIDPAYDNKTVADYYIGDCLYPDFTLQNHNYFHTSYQNVVIQELGEAYLAMALFQGANPKWHTNALMHNNQAVMDNVLRYLALSDGELAMPNGNDWSMFLFDQITSYSTLACFLGDADALLLENLAYKNIKARQTTTSDGSWLLNSDIGPRRMGVEAHRVMMSYLMHEVASTAQATPSDWEAFRADTEDAKVFGTQNIVRASTPARYSIFSWSTGLKNYTGYFVPNDPDLAKIVVPYKANGTGNLLGWYNVDGKSTNVEPVVSGIYDLNGNAWAMNGKLNANGAALENNFAIYSTPGNALIYVDYVVGRAAGTISKEYGGLLAISVDPFLKPMRTLYYANGRLQSDGSEFRSFASPWVNVDNAIGVVVNDPKNQVGFGERGNSNSIYVAKLLASYSNSSRAFAAGDVVDKRGIVYYSGVSADATAALSDALISLSGKAAAGWNGVIASDPDGMRYLLLGNFVGATECEIAGVNTPDGAPVFPQLTLIGEDGATATFRCDVSHSIASPLPAYVTGSGIKAQLMADGSVVIAGADGQAATADIVILADGQKLTKAAVAIPAGGTVKAYAVAGEIVVEGADFPVEGEDDETYFDITDKTLVNNSFELDKTWAATGAITLGGVNYDPCYVQDVPAASADYPQILPVEGWTAGNGLDSPSKYCLMYSMPYSTTMYCVSPAEIGNSTNMIAPPAHFPLAGDRCLNILNSWTTGSNAITQTVTLPAGNYKMKFVGQYMCANENGRPDVATITATNNVNSSLCGVRIGSETIYAFPSQAQTWERVTIPFTLDEPADVTISLGLNTTGSVGAVNNARLYLDDVRLYSEADIDPTSAPIIPAEEAPASIYNLQGMPLPAATAPGLYIINGKKVLVK